MESDLTPEEKLLKLIKEGASKPKQEETQSHVQLESLNPLSPKKFSRPGSDHFQIVRKLSILMGAFIVFLVSILGYQYLIGEPVLPLPLRKGAHVESLELPSTAPKVAESFESYAKVFEGRNIFKVIGAPPPISTPTERALSLSDLVKNLSLSGIISGESPQAIVEDRSNGQIYYVESGDYIGPIQVIEVGDDHVLLRYADEEGQLTL